MRAFKTKITNKNLEQKWFLLDAKEKVLGRLASFAAKLLIGKGKPYFSPHIDCGDFVVIVNAEKVKVTGKKENEKIYFRHSGYPGGARYVSFSEMRIKHPERILEHAVWGMLPKTKLGRKIFKKLHVYAGEKHPHQAQKPERIEMN